MGRRGPPPKPTPLKIAAGNPGKRPLNLREPKPKLGAPTMPAWIDGEAKRAWKHLVPELGTMGILARIDLHSLTCLCQSVAEYEQATRTIQREGRNFEEPIQTAAGEIIGYNRRPHPAVKQQQEAARLVRAFMAEFGLSPASRSRVTCGNGEGQTADGRGSKFFGG